MSVFKIPSQPLQCGGTVTQSVGLQSCVQFYPAVLKFSPSQSLGWHIEYYACSGNGSYNGSGNGSGQGTYNGSGKGSKNGSGNGAKLVRYRVRLNLIKRRYRLVSEFYEYAHSLVCESISSPQSPQMSVFCLFWNAICSQARL